MDVNIFTELIQSLGFPIAMCAALFWYMVKNNENHKKEVDSLKDAVNQLTVVVSMLKEKIGGFKDNEN